MNTVEEIITDLRETAEQCNVAANILEGKGTNKKAFSGTGTTHQPHLVGFQRVRQMTSAGRRAIAQAQKKRWADRHAQKSA